MKHVVLIVTVHAYSLVPMQAVLKNVLNYEALVSPPDRAIAVVANKPVDLIIIDINNGGIASRELIHYFKQQFPLIPLVALVPYGDLDATEYVLKQGADDFISQPIALERLRTSLRNALRLRFLLMCAGQKNGMHSQALHTTEISAFRASCGRIKTLGEIQEEAIECAIQASAGCITQAARMLGVGRSTLYRKIQKMKVLP